MNLRFHSSYCTMNIGHNRQLMTIRLYACLFLHTFQTLSEIPGASLWCNSHQTIVLKCPGLRSHVIALLRHNWQRDDKHNYITFILNIFDLTAYTLWGVELACWTMVWWLLHHNDAPGISDKVWKVWRNKQHNNPFKLIICLNIENGLVIYRTCTV
jgi:hypothetical protein